MSDITAPRYKNESAARRHLERVRWPDGPVCPHCGTVDRASRIKGGRKGLWFCNACRKQFSITVGTLFERSHVPLHKWLLAVHLLSSSKKGMSSHQLHRMLGVTYKTAWFMSHRIREAMRELNPEPLGGGGQTVEVDETYWGKQRHQKFQNYKGWQRKRGWGDKEKILSLVERGGRVRSFHVPNVRAATLRPILFTQLKRDSHLVTDEANFYRKIGLHFITHRRVRHGIREYVRGPVHTNTIENYFSIFKRGLTGIYQHVSAKHLKRYTCEFDFRYNYRQVSDAERTVVALKGIEGKRLTYRRIGPGTVS